mmetsp:Transcript_24351/g.51376  ORF Transcript_24351/g.51376 Transcript_24351/m.51376 type:complete len:84 (+) Transcript_24351:798-1049(+)
MEWSSREEVEKEDLGIWVVGRVMKKGVGGVIAQVDLERDSTAAEIGEIDEVGANPLGARDVATRLARRVERIIIVVDRVGNGY